MRSPQVLTWLMAQLSTWDQIPKLQEVCKVVTTVFVIIVIGQYLIMELPQVLALCIVLSEVYDRKP